MNAYYDKKTIRDIEARGKKVLVRVDFNVPFDEEGKVADVTRIKMVRPTVEYLLNQGAKVILISHLGRPKGKVSEKFSLLPVAAAAEPVLGRPVFFCPSLDLKEVKERIEELPEGGVLLLENIRFHAGEESNDPAFARELASLGDIYVNDAFATAHRAHASTEGVARFLPGVSGFLMEKEVKSLGDALTNPARPFVAVIGGAKVSDKIYVIDNLLQKVDKLLIGGGMANTFLAALGHNMEDSLIERDCLEWAGEFLRGPAKDKLVLPVDLVAAESFSPLSYTVIAAPGGLPAGWRALDIGPQTAAAWDEIIKEAATVFWNGPLGVFEMENFAQGTLRIVQAMANSRGFTLIGGGDSVAAVTKSGMEEQIDHISTGGGASLEFLGGKILPGIAALLDR
ncbi:MAG: phosphoglycerate kinase [Clostridiales bacterium]|nr:phosphoglycerate kinase [Clostridiales bacterium]